MHELAEWLRGRGIEETEIDDVVAHLASSGGLDDARFAKRFADDKRELAGWGPERIREALEARGVEPDAVDAALEGEDFEAQLGRATQLLVAGGRSLDSDLERARALSFLTRRGYPLELAYEAIRRCERAA